MIDFSATSRLYFRFTSSNGENYAYRRIVYLVGTEFKAKWRKKRCDNNWILLIWPCWVQTRRENLNQMILSKVMQEISRPFKKNTVIYSKFFGKFQITLERFSRFWFSFLNWNKAFWISLNQILNHIFLTNWYINSGLKLTKSYILQQATITNE